MSDNAEQPAGADLALADAVEKLIQSSMTTHEFSESRDAIRQLVLDALEDGEVCND